MAKVTSLWHYDIPPEDARISALFNLFANGPFSNINIKWGVDGMDISALDSSHVILIQSWIDSDGKQEANETWYYFTTEEFKDQRGRVKKSRKYKETIIEIQETGKGLLFFWSLANGDSFKVNLTKKGNELDIPKDWLEHLRAFYTEKSKNVKHGRLPDTVVIENLDIDFLNKVCGTFKEFAEILKIHCINQQLVCSSSDTDDLVEGEARQEITTGKGEPVVLLSLHWLNSIIKYFEATGEQIRLYMPNQSPILVEDMQGVTSFMLATRVAEDDSNDEDEVEEVSD